MIASKLSLHTEGVAATLDILGALPPDIAEIYSTPGKITKDPLGKGVTVGRRLVGVELGEYIRVSKLLADKGLAELRQTRPKVINGIFAVPKKDKQRLIIDARRANAHFVECPDVVLPNHRGFSRLACGVTVIVGKSDLDNFYNRIKVPRWMQEYFGLPAVTFGTEKRWPVVLVLPMGLSHSVYVRQNIHERIISAVKGIDGDCQILPNSSPIVDRTRHGIYIDDFCAIGLSIDEIRGVVVDACNACAENGFKTAEIKRKLPP